MTTELRLPDFFIAGTMKGGTTTLYDFICRHDRVARALQKEIHYFSLYPYKGREWYLSHFAPGDGQITGEASPTYFDLAMTDAIPQSIRIFNPAAKVIVITRDPAERAASHFFHLQTVDEKPELAGMNIDEFFSEPFEKCLNVTTERAYLLQRVLYFGAYSRKAMFFKNVFARENLIFLDNRALREEAKATMSRVFSFLGIEDFYDPSFEHMGYSSGRTSSELSPDTLDKLRSFYAEDYAAFVEHSDMSTPPR